ncbi:MAG: HYR domain-containing protein, partial [Bacteroidota bacterium]
RSSEDGCTQYLDFTFNVSDSCENAADQVVVTYSRHWDQTAPELSCPSNYEWDGCEEIPVLVPPVASDNCDGDIVAVGTRSDGLALNDPFPVGQIITVTYTATDSCLNSTSCDFTVYISPCAGSNCSYTQGFYGNVNGNACLPDGGFSKAQAIMAAAVSANGGSVVFGNQSKNGNYFLLKLSDINTYNGDTKEVARNNIFKMLPGGGTPRALVDFATYDDTSTWYPDSDPLNYAKGKRGSINNNLLSQTMTLFFNISLDNGLGNVKLKTSFRTVDEVGCGTDEYNPSDPGEMFSISQNVIDYWGAGATPTVDDLYELANLVLAGTVTSVSASEVNGAVDAINRGFDECRIEVSTVVTPSVVVVGASEDEPVFESFPVPFNDVITLRYKFNYKSDVSIQLFDTKGALLMTERDNNPFLNKEITIRPRFNRGEGQMFFIKVITNRGVSIKKVISEK